MPFTSQTISEPAGTHKTAEKDCVAPSSTLADGGVKELAAEQFIVTLAATDFEGSATLVAVTLTGCEDGSASGAT
ncbi:MAG: hypothetical protein ACRD50_12445 [Candidatus Acidiferrales bacterium]